MRKAVQLMRAWAPIIARFAVTFARTVGNPLVVYDLVNVAAIVLASIGAGEQFGRPVGLMVAGALLIALNIFNAIFSRRR